MADARRPTPRADPSRAGPSPAGTAPPKVDVLSPRVRAAGALWTAGRLDEGAAAFAEAIRQESNNVQAYVVAARSYAEKHQFDRMQQTLEQLVRQAPRHPGVHHYVAETYGMLKLPRRAVAAFEHTARSPGAGPPTWMELASLY